MATPDSFLDMLNRNPRGWGNLPAEPEQPKPQAIFDEYGQPHDTVTGHPLYQNSAPQKSASDSLHDIAMSSQWETAGRLCREINSERTPQRTLPQTLC